MSDLATAFPGLCSFQSLDQDSEKTFRGNRIAYLRITRASVTTPKVPVLVTAGFHAREWAPPDALLSFAKVLLTEGTTGAPDFKPKGIRYPAFLGKLARFLRRSVAKPVVADILDKLDLYILPLANPDGRELTFKAPMSDNMWQRKNLHDFHLPPHPMDPTGTTPINLDLSIGVDLNRNFEVAFDVVKYYDPTFGFGLIQRAKDHNSDTFQGESPLSEPESKNINALMDSKNIQFYFDIHSYQQSVKYSWSINHSQRSTATKNYKNTSFDSGPGSPPGGPKRDNAYAEFLPPQIFNRAQAIAGLMQSGIALVQTPDKRAETEAALSSKYDLQPKRQATPADPDRFDVTGYLLTGGAKDQLTSKQLAFTPSPGGVAESAVPPGRFSFLLEAGSAAEGEFWPHFDREFPKIEREIHFALWALLGQAATPGSAIPIK